MLTEFNLPAPTRAPFNCRMFSVRDDLQNSLKRNARPGPRTRLVVRHGERLIIIGDSWERAKADRRSFAWKI
eukprot:1553171-Pyramimonas_sp.AAC.1